MAHYTPYFSISSHQSIIRKNYKIAPLYPIYSTPIDFTSKDSCPFYPIFNLSNMLSLLQLVQFVSHLKHENLTKDLRNCISSFFGVF